jgi:4-hydroxybenzoate polyprenyltransferase
MSFFVSNFKLPMTKVVIQKEITDLTTFQETEKNLPSCPQAKKNAFNEFVFSLFRVFIYSNIFISLCSVGLTISSYLILLNFNIESFSIYLILLVFFSTLLIYNFHIIFISASNKELSSRGKWIYENKKFVKALVIISFAGIFYTSFFLSIYQLVFLSHLACLAFFYIAPFKLSKFDFSLRKYSLVKIFVLAYVWAAATVVLPAMEMGKLLHYETIIVFIERFLFILALAIPSDIRDYSKDKNESLLTIPGWLGIVQAKNLSIGILLFYILFSFFTVVVNEVSIARAISAVFAVFLIRKIDETVSDSYYMFWIDGVMMFYFLILMLVHVCKVFI